MCVRQVSFVFVCKVDGKDIGDEPPPPIALGAAAGAGGAGPSGAGPLRLPGAGGQLAGRPPLSSLQAKVRMFCSGA
jgi:hypothetical protein